MTLLELILSKILEFGKIQNAPRTCQLQTTKSAPRTPPCSAVGGATPRAKFSLHFLFFLRAPFF